MRHGFLDRYSQLESPVHRLPAAMKLAATVVVILATIAFPPPAPVLHISLGVVLLAVAAMTRIPPLFLLRRLLTLEPLALGIALLALLRPGGTALFAGLMIRSTISLFAVILLANTTPFVSILDTLTRMRVPRILVTMLALMYRYLFVLIDEAERMQRARLSRSASGSRKAVWSSGAMLIGQLFVRSTERAERIYAAMCARGWQ
jgi:cobalt/nickel transport system permease protein